MIQLESGAVDCGRTTPLNLALWLVAYGIGTWSGIQLGILHQSTFGDVKTFLTTIFINADVPWIRGVCIGVLWFSIICMLGHAPCGRWLLLCVTAAKSAQSAYVFSLVYSVYFATDGDCYVAIFLAHTFLFWVGTFGFMAHTQSHDVLCWEQKTIVYHALFCVYFILSSCFKFWSLQSL